MENESEPLCLSQSHRHVANITHLGVAQVVQSLLVGGVGLLQVIHHQVTVTQTAPGLAAGGVQLQDILEVFDGLGELFLGAQDARDGVHGGDGPLIVAQSLFVRVHCAIQITHQLGQAACRSHTVSTQLQGSLPLVRRRWSFFIPIWSHTCSFRAAIF